jgi:pimeloyl-ACP methyl ester carboxylesterase
MSFHALRLLQPRSPQPHLPLFVFFPGMDGTGTLLHRQIDGLADKFDIRCLAISSDNRTNWTELTDDSVRLILGESIEDRAIYLCGESFGACLAMQVAAKMPAKIGKLVLIAPASSVARFPWLSIGSALSSLLPDPIYPFSARILVDFLINSDRVTATDRQSLITAMLSIRPQIAAWRLNLLGQFQVDRIVAKIVDIPVLLIAGKLDRLLPSLLEVRILQQCLTKSTTILLPHSGHACLLEKDINLVDLILKSGIADLS